MIRALPLCILVLLNLIIFSEASCSKVFENKIDKREEEHILEIHNYYRKLIANGLVRGQPKGVNLKRLKYDQNLAKNAQYVSNSCVFRHQTITDGRWDHVGQNLYIKMSTGFDKGANWTEAIKSWFDEQEEYKFGTFRHTRQNIGHYTQMVWANTDSVGCGYTFFEDSLSPYKYQKLYTCNYGPAGNYIGQLPYQTGHKGCENLC